MTESQKYNKILILSPPGKVYVHSDGAPAARKHCSPPIGIAYLLGNLRRHNYEVGCLDILVEGYEIEDYREPFIVYGLPTEDVIERIRVEKPDVIGFSVLFSMVAKEALEISAVIKETFPHIPIVFGGHHSTGAADQVMSHSFVDFVISGEADQRLVDLMDALNDRRPLDSVHGLYYRKPDGTVDNTLKGVTALVEGNGWNYFDRKNSGVPIDLDGLPLPAWDVVGLEKYWDSFVRTGGGDAIGDRYAVMVTTRGCPHVCSFCTSPLVSGYKAYRKRSLDAVVAEVRWLVEEYGIKEIQFVEENMFVSKKRLKELLAVLAEEFDDITFWNTGGVDVNALDTEVIDLMVEANFHRAILAIEAGDPEVQEARVDKNVNLDRLPELVDYMLGKGIDLKALYMIGFPGETKKQIQKTIDYAMNLGVLDFNLSIVQPLPGTPLYDECVQNDLFIEGIPTVNFAISNVKLPDLTPEELEDLRRDTWKQAFSKRMKIEQQEQMRQELGHSGEVMHRYSTIEEYETLGFATKPPARQDRRLGAG
jgi:anaerobic magnesium-protoporphyrin IX monomethyl ester cyclase